jgi:hypothetical protein
MLANSRILALGELPAAPDGEQAEPTPPTATTVIINAQSRDM